MGSRKFRLETTVLLHQESKLILHAQAFLHGGLKLGHKTSLFSFRDVGTLRKLRKGPLKLSALGLEGRHIGFNLLPVSILVLPSTLSLLSSLIGLTLLGKEMCYLIL